MPGTVATFECASNYTEVAGANVTRVCTDYGFWSENETQPICVDVGGMYVTSC